MFVYFSALSASYDVSVLMFNSSTHRRVLRAGSYYVVYEGIPLDIQHVALVTTNLWIVRLNAS